MSEIVTVVEIKSTRVWIENDLFGCRYVMVKHDGCEPFEYAAFGYDYRYTSNAGTWEAAKSLAISLGATEPVEEVHRGIPSELLAPTQVHEQTTTVNGHTKEPWRIVPTRCGLVNIVGGEGTAAERYIFDAMQWKAIPEDPHRIVACVNALADYEVPDDAEPGVITRGIRQTLHTCFEMKKQIDALTQQRDKLLSALEVANSFITNGIALGYIRMPDDDCPDPAHHTPGIVRAAIAEVEAGK